MIKRRNSIKPLTVAISSAIIFASLSGHAAITKPNNQIKQDYPLGTMADWLTDADKYALNPVNIRAGKHPDREDPNKGPYDVIYIFPDTATANAWRDPITNPTGMRYDIEAHM